MKDLGRSTEYLFTDSSAHATTNTDWLQGEMMNIISRKLPSLVQKEKTKIDKLGR